MAADMQLVWTLSGPGWADCAISDHQAEAEIEASYISTAPEDLLTAVARLVAGEAEVRVQFEAEPTAFRWILYREGTDVWIRVLELADGSMHDNAGTEIWSSQQSIGTVARAVVRCFDEVARTYGESGYRGTWGEHFPRFELEALREGPGTRAAPWTTPEPQPVDPPDPPDTPDPLDPHPPPTRAR